MQFETFAMLALAIALLAAMFVGRRTINRLKAEIEVLHAQGEKLRGVAVRQRDEIDRLIHTAEQERRARQMATLAAVANKPAPRPPITKPKEWKDPDLARDPYKNDRMARKQEEATRADPGAGNNWDDGGNSWNNPGNAYAAPIAPSPAPAAAYQGGGGSFDGGGASGDYDRPNTSSASMSTDSTSCSTSSDSYSSSDSGSSSSSDSSSSCSSD